MDLKDKIYTIRNQQVMLDRDLAELYEVPTGHLNRAVKRNFERFPSNFYFQLTSEEYTNNVLRCQTGILKNSRGKHKKYLTYAFTEQGIAMLSAVLKSKTAIKVSIKIMETFIQMRKIISLNSNIFFRLDRIEMKQLEYQNISNEKFDKIFKAIEKPITPKYGIFFENQIFDAYEFVSSLIKQAKEEIILIDNYIDESTLLIFSKTKVKTTIYTKEITKQLELDLKKYNQQYNNIEIKIFQNSHDRFLIIDNQTYHLGASLKDLGKRWFAFSRINITKEILEKLSSNHA